jgi:hypothetical protein
VRTFRALAAMWAVITTFGRAGTAVPAPPPTTPAAPSTASSIAAAAPALVAAAVGTPPPEPSVAGAGLIVTLTRMGFTVLPAGPWGPGISATEAAPFALDPATQGRIQDLLRSPGSVFSAEREALRTELGGRTPEQALAALRAEDVRYRDLLYAVVARVLPPHLQAYLPTLRHTFDLIDEHIHGLPAPGPYDPFPVRTVPDNGRLRPHVRRLVLRQVDGDEVSLQNIATDLQRLMRAQAYLAPSLA